MELVCANNIECNNCIYHPYCNKQKSEINWGEIKPGTLIYVRNNPSDKWLERCFVKYAEPLVWIEYKGDFWLYRFAKLEEDENEDRNNR